MGRQIDLRNPSVNQVTAARTNELNAVADEVSDQFLGDHILRIEDFDAMTGNPSLVASESATPLKGNYVQRALNHVMEINPALGFAPTQAPEFISDPQIQTVSSGAVAVNLHQQYKGIRIFQVAPTVRFNPDGSLAESAGSVVTVADDLDVTPKLKVTEAVGKAAEYIAAPQPDEEQEVDPFGEPLPFTRVDVSNFAPQIIAAFTNNPEMPTVLAAGPFAEEIKANLLWFALDKSNLRLAWEILISMPGLQEQYRTLVDAESGQILYCRQLVAAIAARGSVFLVDGAEAREIVSFPRDLADYHIPIPNDLPGGFPDAWVADQLASGNTVSLALNGNPAAVQGVDENGVLTFDIADQTSDDQKLLNLFYYLNFIHNFFYLFGFREADGNFQKNNFGRGGIASDAVQATVHSQPVWGTANMGTRIDGMSPTMNMGLVSRTGLHTAIDSSVVFHEFTHGVTNRLVGGPMNAHALEAEQSAGMGEGWGDYIACTINRSETVGNWVTGKELGIRGFRYDENFPAHFGHLGTGRYVSPHAIGEIWCAALLAMNRRVGVHLGVQLVVDALKLSPVTPSFLDMRDSILRALDNKRLAGQLDDNEYQTARRGIWETFARFGMGVNARSNGASLSGIVADSDVPDFPASPLIPQPTTPAGGDHSNMQNTNNLLSDSALRLAEAAEWSADRQEKFADVLAAIRIHGEELAKLPNVVGVRPGFRFHAGKITDQPCIAVSVLKKRDLSEVASPQLIPQKLGKVLVDVVPATPFEQIRHREKQSQAEFDGESLTGEVSTILPGEEDFLESVSAAVPLLPYEPPAGTPLEPVEDEMTVICHASPDAGWRNLDDFLRGTNEKLTATMYEFNAGYILDSLVGTFGNSKNLNLILDGGSSALVPSAMQGDVSKNQVRQRLNQRLGNRFDFAWAAVADDGKTTSSFFPSAYHIKVAVRDCGAFWLSSGNWKRSNQPQIDPFEQPASFNGWSFLRSKGNNREWHVIIEHPGLAELFETYITNDIESAKPLQRGGAGFESLDAMPDLFVPEEFFTDGGGRAAFEQPTFFRERTFNKRVRVQPLLTPDKDEDGNALFARHILELIENAQEKIYFQNQSLKPDWNNAQYTELFRALARKSRDQNLDVRIIVSEFADLSVLASSNVNIKRVRKQRECHNKGIIVDDQKVVVGSHNWTGQGATRNRDASLIFDDAEIAAYFKEIFLFDWDNLATSEDAFMSLMPIVAREGEPTPAGMARVAWHDFFSESRSGFDDV